jgi:hypothetical protein
MWNVQIIYKTKQNHVHAKVSESVYSIVQVHDSSAKLYSV